MTNNAQQKLGYRDIVFNVKTNKFYEHRPGDNYKELDINLDEGDDSGAAETTTSNVLLEDVSTLSISDPGGLTTQKDLNHYFAENIVTKTSELENDAGFITAAEGGVDLDDYARLDGADFTGQIRGDATLIVDRIGIRPDPFEFGRPAGDNISLNPGEIIVESGDLDDRTSIKTGTVTAKEFIGDGSQLTNLPQPTIDYTRSSLGEPPSSVWVHIKNIRGGELHLNTASASVLAVHALYQGAAVPWARDEDGKRHYGNSLFLAGRLNMDNSETDVLRYGDASYATLNGDEEQQDNVARDLIAEWGFNPDNFCGLVGYESEKIILDSVIEIDGQEAPNTFEYIVYLTDNSNPPTHEWYRTDPGTTFDIGEYTFTTNRTQWEQFFDGRSFVPNVQYLDTSNGTNFKKMFCQANLSGTLGIGSLSVGKGENFEECFYQAKDFDANLSNWDMSSATNVRQMLAQIPLFSCNRRSLKDTGLDTWNLENVTNANNFIYQCDSFEHDMSSVRLPNIDSLPITYNERCPIRLSNGELSPQEGSSGKNNEPWTVQTNQPWSMYWSATRLTKNPVIGATGALDTERKKLYQEYIDYVDAKVEAGEWQSWDKQYPEGGNSASKEPAKEKVAEVIAADAQLVIDYEL